MYFFCATLLVFISACVHQTKVPVFTSPVHTSHYLSRKFSVYHEGIDIPKKTGTPILNIAQGKVVYTGSQFSGYGKLIIIKHTNTWSSLYAHLHKILVKKGATVYQRQKIGEIGNTGRSSAPHLHFELIKNKQPVNPIKYITF